MSGSMNTVREWTGPALFSYGFRPFFLGGAVFAAVAMLLWIGMLEGHVVVPTAFDPVSWHAHELLFGFLGAIIAGFLLTAVPNWTGRLPIAGYALALLFGLWGLGRVAVAYSASWPPLAAAVIDLSMPILLLAAIGREVAIGRNWRNLPVLALVALMTVSNAVFHWEAVSGEYAAQGYGMRLGLGTVIILIALIGGRIVPSFTRNWLIKQGSNRLPAPPMARYDVLSLAVLVAALSMWVVWPDARFAGMALFIAGVLQAFRLVRWQGFQTAGEPLVWILHVGFGFLPLGALALGAALIWPDSVGTRIGPAAAQHLWMAGAVGIMVLAVMTRATQGHTGQPLTATAGTTVLYMCVVAAAVSRALVDWLPVAPDYLYMISAAGWIAAFGGFAVLYGPALCRPHHEKGSGA